MARTERYTAEQVAQALTKSMGLVSVAAQSLGCSQTTVRTYIERYESVKQAQLDSREQMVDLGEAALVKAVKKGEGWAVALLLKTLGKGRGYVEKQELNLSGEVNVRTPNIFLPQKQDDTNT